VTPVPHVRPPVYPAELGPSRLAAHVQQALPVACRVAILGLPDDLGVRLNNGRPGASEGPAAFRAAFARYGVHDPSGWAWPKVFDAGDVIPADGHDAAALDETHRRVTEAASALLDLGLFPIAIGGGHDLTFPFVRAVSARAGPLSGVYFDAHLDVRETVGSGMPFRRLIEECDAGPLLVTGLDPFANSRQHVEWFVSRGGIVHDGRGGRGAGQFDEAGDSRAAAAARGVTAPARSLREVLRTDRDSFVSFDMDCLDASAAPGVSAINPAGLTVAGAAHQVEKLGADPRVRCFDIMELNPRHDQDGRTARAAVRIFLTFLRGLASRETPSGPIA
jgi:arginase family enzyme